MLRISYMRPYDESEHSLTAQDIRSIEYTKGNFGVTWDPANKFVKWGRLRLEWVRGSGLFIRHYPTYREICVWHFLCQFERA